MALTKNSTRIFFLDAGATLGKKILNGKKMHDV
jgi:hypothetical protein